MPTKIKSLYSQVINITEEFLGPAGERFIRRQIQTHLNIEPEKLEKRHLPDLVKWSSLAFAMLTNDTGSVAQFKNDLLALSKPSRKQAQVD